MVRWRSATLKMDLDDRSRTVGKQERAGLTDQRVSGHRDQLHQQTAAAPTQIRVSTVVQLSCSRRRVNDAPRRPQSVFASRGDGICESRRLDS
jgi:hypothetical protein